MMAVGVASDMLWSGLTASVDTTEHRQACDKQAKVEYNTLLLQSLYQQRGGRMFAMYSSQH